MEQQFDGEWFYSRDGERKGAFSQAQMLEMINSGAIGYGTPVWRKGTPEWVSLEHSELSMHLVNQVVPPLTGSQVNNTVVWFLAFAPIIGLFLEYFFSFMINGNTSRAEYAVENGNYWYITVLLNVALSIWDEKILKKAGMDTSKFKIWVCIVPVYLFQRAKFLQQNVAYFIVWLICFALIMVASI